MYNTYDELPSLYRLTIHSDTYIDRATHQHISTGCDSTKTKKRRVVPVPVAGGDAPRLIVEQLGMWTAKPISLPFTKLSSHIIHYHGQCESRKPVYLATQSAALHSLAEPLSERGLYTLKDLTENEVLPGNYEGTVLQTVASGDNPEDTQSDSKNLLWIEDEENGGWKLVDGTNGPLPWFYLVNSVFNLGIDHNVVFDQMGGLSTTVPVAGLRLDSLIKGEYTTLDSIKKSELLTVYGEDYWKVHAA
jgi:hypothetical protein